MYLTMMNKQEKYSDPVWIVGMEYNTLPFYTKYCIGK